MKIGLSVSKCISEMALGNVDPGSVEKIIARTSVRSKADLEWLVKKYREEHWKGVEERAESLFWQLWAEDKIYQPRIHEHWLPSNENGIWVNSEDEIVRIPSDAAMF